MRLQKFEAPTIKEAVAKVKADLGPDAMIVSTRQVKRGMLKSTVEVTAALDEPEVAPTATPPASPSATSTKSMNDIPIGPASWISDADVERILAPIRSELRTVKAQLRERAGAHEDAGLRQQLADLRSAMTHATGRRNVDDAALHRVVDTHRIAAPSKKRVVALVGPTGAGKTTTVAKLAARAALAKRQMVALVSVDTYRVGGEDQIRIFADLIGVPLVMVRRLENLAAAIDDLAGYARVFIDTAGRSPRDGHAIEELSSALCAVSEVETHLTMPAGLGAHAIDACVHHWKGAEPNRILFTKLDEALSLEELVRAPGRHACPIAWFTTGQRVPEDLEEATQENLLDLALRGSLPDEAAA